MAAREPAGVDAYLAGVAPEARAVLERIRAMARAIAPDATEAISYGIPTFKRDGRPFHFAAFTRHVGLYPPVRGDARLEKALARYANPKGNLALPLDEPIPYALVERVIRHHLLRKR